MTKSEFQNKLAKVNNIANKYRWTYVSKDQKTFRISFKDELSIHRVDIYLSRMTVCLLPVGGKPVYLKRQNLEMIEGLFKNPFKYE